MRQRDKDMIDRLLLDHPLGVVDRSETFEIREEIVSAIAEIADDSESELGVRAHALDDRPRQLAVSGNQHAIEALPGAVTALGDESNDAASEDDKEKIFCVWFS